MVRLGYYRDSAYQFRMQMPKLRKSKGLSQVELADLIGVEQPTISRMERADEGATLRQYKSAASALGVTLSELFASDREASEIALLRAFRKLPPERQQGWLDMARMISRDH